MDDISLRGGVGPLLLSIGVDMRRLWNPTSLLCVRCSLPVPSPGLRAIPSLSRQLSLILSSARVVADDGAGAGAAGAAAASAVSRPPLRLRSVSENTRRARPRYSFRLRECHVLSTPFVSVVTLSFLSHVFTLSAVPWVTLLTWLVPLREAELLVLAAVLVTFVSTLLSEYCTAAFAVDCTAAPLRIR